MADNQATQDATAFLTGGGEMGALMRVRDWSGSPLGAPGTWPQSLRSVAGLLLGSKFPMFVAWGEELGFLYNDAYAEILGAKHPKALGSRFHDIWPEIWPDISPLVDAAMAGEATYRENLPLIMNRKGFEEQTWFTFSYSPVRDESGGVAGLFCACTETTAQVLAERRQAFRLAFETRLRDLAHPEAIMQAAVALLGEHLGADRVGYSDIVDDRIVRTTGSYAVNGIAPLVGDFPIESFGEAMIARQRQGITEASADVLADRADDIWAAIDTRSVISVPLVRNGQFVASLYVNNRDPRVWLADDVALIEEVAARTWDAVERARAEAALRETSRRLNAVLDNASVSIFLINGERQCVYMNPAAEHLTGYALAETRGRHLHALIHHTRPDGSAYPANECPIDGVSPTSDGQQGEEVFIDKSGRFLPVAFSASAIRDETGAPVGTIVEVQDITERKAADARLRELNATLERRVADALAERQVLADFVDSTDAAVLACDLGFGILAINAATIAQMERVYGMRPRVGDNLLDVLDHMPEHRAQVERHWSRALSGEEFVVLDEFGDPGRERVHFEVRFHALRDRDGKRIGAFQAAHDITDRVRAAAELEAAQDALRQAQKMEAVGQLTGGIAHDFNNLLAAVVGAFDLIRRKPDDVDRVRRYAKAGLAAAERGAKLTGQLLAFSRAQRIELKPVIVTELVEGMRDLLARTLGPMIQLSVSLRDDGAVLSDRTQLEMALLNLAINARDAMPDGGELRIAAFTREIRGDPDLAAGRYVELCVADIGTGMPPDVVARAFDPFFTTKGVGKGTGLGLSQVYGIARQAGGTVRIDSRPGEGTTVRLFLPRTSLSVAASAGPEAGMISSPQGAATILVVDDDPDVRRMLVDSLESLGYSVVEAGDGLSGIAALEAHAPDLMVIDFAMPGMNGAEVAKAARERRPEMPIVFASGYADTAAIEKVAGADATVLRKPFRVDELQLVISDALRSQA